MLIDAAIAHRFPIALRSAHVCRPFSSLRSTLVWAMALLRPGINRIEI
jgi:hypothetical protein